MSEISPLIDVTGELLYEIELRETDFVSVGGDRSFT